MLNILTIQTGAKNDSHASRVFHRAAPSLRSCIPRGERQAKKQAFLLASASTVVGLN